jgi:ribosomal protein S18 acetylase RimI-like enzyme
LAVDGEYRRRGIGQALVEKTVEAMRRERLPGCNLFVLDSNTAGRTFWESQGWAVPDTWNVMNRRFE